MGKRGLTPLSHRRLPPPRRTAAALLLALASLALASLALPVTAAGDEAADELALAQRHAPVVKLRRQVEPCDSPGTAYYPVAVEAVLGRPDVVLVGPDGTRTPAPTAADVAGKGIDWYLDFPGNPVRPGCDYDRWFAAIAPSAPPTIYAHVAREDGRIGLQYWLYYVFNHWNNTHEGDWEMVQLMFDAPTAADALAQEPVEVGFSQHTGGERSPWSGGSLEREGDRPVLYPAAGSHAHFFSSRLWLGFSAETGVGCDDTRPESVRLDPAIVMLPDEVPATGPLAWLAFGGRWGENVRGPYSGPTGPAAKRQWAEPVAWTDQWRSSSLSVPEGRSLGPTSTDLFCGGVAAGSLLVLRLLYDPLFTFAAIVLVVGGLVLLVRRTRWSPLDPAVVDRPRRAGVMLRDAWAIYRARPRTMLAIGAVAIPLGLLGTAVLLGLLELLGLRTLLEGEGGASLFGGISFLVLSGGLSTVAPLVVVGVGVATALGDLAGGAEARADARRVLRLLPRAAGAVLLALLIQGVLLVTVVGAPLALVVLIVTSLAIPAVVLEGRRAVDALRRSRVLVRGRFLRVLAITLAANGMALLAGPLLGLAMLLLLDASLALIDLVSALVYAAVLPFGAIVQTLLFYDARARAARAEDPARVS